MPIEPNQAACGAHDPEPVLRGRREQLIRHVAWRLQVPPDEVFVTTRREGTQAVLTALWLPGSRDAA